MLLASEAIHCCASPGKPVAYNIFPAATCSAGLFFVCELHLSLMLTCTYGRASFCICLSSVFLFLLVRVKWISCYQWILISTQSHWALFCFNGSLSAFSSTETAYSDLGMGCGHSHPENVPEAGFMLFWSLFFDFRLENSTLWRNLFEVTCCD